MKEVKISGWLARDGKAATTKGRLFFYFSKPILQKTGFQKDQWNDALGSMEISRELFKTGLRIGECKQADIIIRISESKSP